MRAGEVYKKCPQIYKLENTIEELRAENKQVQLSDKLCPIGKTNTCGYWVKQQKQIEQLQAKLDKLKKLLHYLSGMQDKNDYLHKYPVEHNIWAVGQQNGSITGDFDKWLIEQSLKDK